MMILVAGPYRSGTNDDPALIKKNVEEMQSYALPIFRAGHIPFWVSGWRSRWLNWPGRGRSETRPSMRSSTPLRFDFWEMRCSPSSGRPLGRGR